MLFLALSLLYPVLFIVLVIYIFEWTFHNTVQSNTRNVKSFPKIECHLVYCIFLLAFFFVNTIMKRELLWALAKLLVHPTIFKNLHYTPLRYKLFFNTFLLHTTLFFFLELRSCERCSMRVYQSFLCRLWWRCIVYDGSSISDGYRSGWFGH